METRLHRWPKTLLAVLVMLCAVGLAAQQDAKPPATALTQGSHVDASRKSSDAPSYPVPRTNTETTAAGYELKQSAEFGGRIADFSGNQGTWDTFVNLGSGPRLLEYSLDMHSPTHTGLFFDDLTFSNFGYGGDPINVSRLHVLKGTLFNLNASFRRDRNVFDYNLLANPLCPQA